MFGYSVHINILDCRIFEIIVNESLVAAPFESRTQKGNESTWHRYTGTASLTILVRSFQPVFVLQIQVSAI